MRVKLNVPLRGAKGLWPIGKIFNDQDGPLPGDVLHEVKLKSRKVTILMDGDDPKTQAVVEDQMKKLEDIIVELQGRISGLENENARLKKDNADLKASNEKEEKRISDVHRSLKEAFEKEKAEFLAGKSDFEPKSLKINFESKSDIHAANKTMVETYLTERGHEIGDMKKNEMVELALMVFDEEVTKLNADSE